jgi:hypothetical protein
VYTEENQFYHTRKSHETESKYTNFCGEVRLTLNAKEVLDNPQCQLWWGPAPFVFDRVTFYQVVYKKYDEETREVSFFKIIRT